MQASCELVLDTRELTITSVELLPDVDASAAQKLEFRFGETHQVGRVVVARAPPFPLDDYVGRRPWTIGRYLETVHGRPTSSSKREARASVTGSANHRQPPGSPDVI